MYQEQYKLCANLYLSAGTVLKISWKWRDYKATLEILFIYSSLSIKLWRTSNITRQDKKWQFCQLMN